MNTNGPLKYTPLPSPVIFGTPSTKGTPRIPIIIGGVIGGLALTIIVVQIILCYRKRKINKSSTLKEIQLQADTWATTSSTASEPGDIESGAHTTYPPAYAPVSPIPSHMYPSNTNMRQERYAAAGHISSIPTSNDQGTILPSYADSVQHQIEPLTGLWSNNTTQGQLFGSSYSNAYTYTTFPTSYSSHTGDDILPTDLPSRPRLTVQTGYFPSEQLSSEHLPSGRPRSSPTLAEVFHSVGINDFNRGSGTYEFLDITDNERHHLMIFNQTSSSMPAREDSMKGPSCCVRNV